MGEGADELKPEDIEFYNLGELLDAEGKLYLAYVKAGRGEDTATGRVSPKKVKKAQATWYSALAERQDMTARVARETGLKTYQVLHYYYATRQTNKKVKRG